MDTADLQIGFAEITTALAGFAGISTITGRVSDRTPGNLLAVKARQAGRRTQRARLIYQRPRTLSPLENQGYQATAGTIAGHG